MNQQLVYLTLLLIPTYWVGFPYPLTLLVLSSAYLVHNYLITRQANQLEHHLSELRDLRSANTAKHQALDQKVSELESRIGIVGIALAQKTPQNLSSLVRKN